MIALIPQCSAYLARALAVFPEDCVMSAGTPCWRQYAAVKHATQSLKVPVTDALDKSKNLRLTPPISGPETICAGSRIQARAMLLRFAVPATTEASLVTTLSDSAYSSLSTNAILKSAALYLMRRGLPGKTVILLRLRWRPRACHLLYQPKSATLRLGMPGAVSASPRRTLNHQRLPSRAIRPPVRVVLLRPSRMTPTVPRNCYRCPRSPRRPRL